jgi:hypothetical protein
MQVLVDLPKANVMAPEKKVHLPTPKLMKVEKFSVPKPPSVPTTKSGAAPKTKPSYGMTNPILTPKHKKENRDYYG